MKTPTQPKKPVKPEPPLAMIRQPKILELDKNCTIDALIRQLPEGVDRSKITLRAETRGDYDDCDVETYIEWNEFVQNDKYDSQYVSYLEHLKKYELALITFETKMEEWRTFEKANNAKQIAKLEAEIAQLRKRT